MNADTAAKVRITGLVRSPEREGALAHFEPDRGFALVARAAMGLTDVIDPTIWVKEKISLALGVPDAADEEPLKRALAALRSIHGELMARGERERTWVAVLLAVFHEGDGAAVLAGDCACYRFRDGLLARLGRSAGAPAGLAPVGALGTETQVRIEVVPLRPQRGDCYILATEPLGDGELARLARELESAPDELSLLRRALDGKPDKGRVALVLHRGAPPPMDAPRADALRGTAENLASLGAGEVDAALAPLALEPLDAEVRRAAGTAPPVSPEPVAEESHEPEGAPTGEPAFLREAREAAAGGSAPEAEPWTPEAPGPDAEATEGGEEAWAGVVESETGAEAEPGAGPEAQAEAGPPEAPAEALEVAEEMERADSGARRRRRGLATLDEARPWYEPLALWGAGALAIVALAILVRSIVPGILGEPRERGARRVAPSALSGTVDLFSEPPGAAIRVDGVPIERRTPATGLALEPGVHRVELDWGPYGSWADTVEVVTGERLALHPRVTGRVAFRSSDPARLLDVYLDGTYVGSTPLALEEVSVGRHLVRFGAPGASASAQDFELFRDTPLELIGNAGSPPQPGSITIRTALLGDEGFQAGKGDPVWVDGTLRGVTPLTASLPPGAHSVRVVRRGFPAQVSIIEVKPGGEHFATAEFGARSGEPLVFAPPLSISLSDPAPLTIAVPETDWGEAVTVWLHAAPPGGSFIARRMAPVEGQPGTFAGLVAPEVLGNASRRVRVYFRAVGPAGQEIHSEIQAIPVKL